MMRRRHPQVIPRPEAENEHISTNWREFWSSKLPCWDTVWHLSDPGKKLSPLPPFSPPGAFAWPPSSLRTRGWTVIPSALIFHVFSSKLTNRTMTKQVSWTREIWHKVSHPCVVWLTEEGCSHVFGPQVVLRGSGVKVQPICWRFLFGPPFPVPRFPSYFPPLTLYLLESALM